MLNVYNWSDYIGKETVSKFEKATGIKVRYDVYDSNEVLEAKLLAGHSGYDLEVPSSSPYLERMAKAKVFLKLDKAKLTATTLPMVIFSSVRLGVSPQVNALATILVAVVTIAAVIAGRLMARPPERQLS